MTQAGLKTPSLSLNRLFFSSILFLSAALLFAVQPMLGKMLLPLVGGAPSGWLTALAFFQLTLLAGYYIAHLLSKLTARGQLAATLALLVLGLIVLPPHLPATVENASSTGHVLVLLMLAIGLPFLALSTVASGLQRSYAAGRSTQDPYFLYAASNAGSFVGLLSYPLLVEPLLPLSVQNAIWAGLYGALILLIGALLLMSKTETMMSAQSDQQTAASSISWRQRLMWLMLAFIPSSLSMGLTALITADMGSLPLFWVVPLALYLLTFVIAFSRRRQSDYRWLGPACLLLAGAIFAVWTADEKVMTAGPWFIVALAVVFFLTALSCHIKLAALRPASSKLTEFYLWLALGGALGGVFNIMIVPFIFPYALEFYVLLFTSLALHQPLRIFFRNSKNFKTQTFIGLFLILGAIVGTSFRVNHLITMLLVFLGAVILAARPMRLAVLCSVLTVAMMALLSFDLRLTVARNFFGLVYVVDARDPAGETVRMLKSGPVMHGMQRLTPQPDLVPGMNMTALDKVFSAYAYPKIALVGLGAGMALCFNNPERHFTVYEIDPKFQKIAQEKFAFVRGCGEPRWRIGDGRAELQRDSAERYDVIMVDAFQSAYIPTHLLTREALAVYASRLNPNGILLFNINNLYYDLYPPLAAIAKDGGWQAWRSSKQPFWASHFNWVLMGRAGQNFSWLQALGWQTFEDLAKNYSIWQDDHVNLLAALTINRDVPVNTKVME